MRTMHIVEKDSRSSATTPFSNPERSRSRVRVGKGVPCLALGLALTMALTARAQLSVGTETGAVISGYNDVRVPNVGGTTFSLSEDLSTPTKAFVRVRVSYAFAGRHWVSLLVAPLRLQARGSLGRALRFGGADFPAHAPLSAVYRFDSYRVTYRYQLDHRGAVRIAVVITAKIRDAAIRLQTPGISRETTNTGFVPLLSGQLAWWPAPRTGLVLDMDALAAPQGRAEDILAAAVYAPSRHLQLYGGYRLLEGGADVDQLYNFALLHYLCFGANWTF